ncbi:hypothetical protein QJQ45_016641, partial [Haematococcus lacustris]
TDAADPPKASTKPALLPAPEPQEENPSQHPDLNPSTHSTPHPGIVPEPQQRSDPTNPTDGQWGLSPALGATAAAVAEAAAAAVGEAAAAAVGEPLGHHKPSRLPSSCLPASSPTLEPLHHITASPSPSSCLVAGVGTAAVRTTQGLAGKEGAGVNSEAVAAGGEGQVSTLPALQAGAGGLGPGVSVHHPSFVPAWPEFLAGAAAVQGDVEAVSGATALAWIRALARGVGPPVALNGAQEDSARRQLTSLDLALRQAQLVSLVANDHEAAAAIKSPDNIGRKLRPRAQQAAAPQKLVATTTSLTLSMQASHTLLTLHKRQPGSQMHQQEQLQCHTPCQGQGQAGRQGHGQERQGRGRECSPSPPSPQPHSPLPSQPHRSDASMCDVKCELNKSDSQGAGVGVMPSVTEAVSAGA